jgi:hypothetical protein
MPSRSTDPEKFKGQTRIEGDQVGQGDIPEGTSCNWCANPATASFEIKRKIKGARGGGAAWPTGQFWFACDDHHGSAERMVAEPLPSHRKR